MPEAPDFETVTERVRRIFVAGFTIWFYSGSFSAIAEQSHDMGPVHLSAPRLQTPAPMIKPKQEHQIPKQTPAPGNVGAGHGAPQQQSQTGRLPLMSVEHPPSSGVQQVRPRSVYRGVGGRINVAGGVLVLPVVAYYGVPVILDVPELGLVDVPEEEYARLYEQLSSSDFEQAQEAMSSLRKLKEREEAEVEVWQRGPETAEPADTRDLSEPISFDAPSRAETRRRRLY